MRFASLMNKMLAIRLDCLIGSEPAEPSRAEPKLSSARSQAWFWALSPQRSFPGFHAYASNEVLPVWLDLQRCPESWVLPDPIASPKDSLHN